MEYLSDFISTLKSEGKSENTLIGYRSDIQQFFRAIDKPTAEVSQIDARRYFNGLTEAGRSERTRCRHLASITMYYEWCINEDLIENSPVKKIKAPKIPKRLPKFLPEEDLTSLFDSAKTIANKAVLRVLYSTGARVSELCGFDREDFDFIHHTANVRKGKGNKQRFVYLTDDAIEAVRAYWSTRTDDNPAALLNAHGHRIQSSNVQEMIKKLGVKCGIKQKCHPHLLRKTLASHLVQRGADILVVSQVLGHENVATTQIYAALTDTVRRKVFDDLINKAG